MTAGARQPTATPYPDRPGWILFAAVTLGVLWLGGFGSIAALLLARGEFRLAVAQARPPSRLARAARIIGWMGLVACVFAACAVVASGTLA